MSPRRFPKVPQLAGSASSGHTMPENAVFRIDSADTSPSLHVPTSPKSAPPCTSPVPRAMAAPRSSAACFQRAGASDGSPQAEASSNVRITIQPRVMLAQSSRPTKNFGEPLMSYTALLSERAVEEICGRFSSYHSRTRDRRTRGARCAKAGRNTSASDSY